MSQAFNDLRNIAFLGHGGSGKTSLAEAILFKAGVTNRMGRVEEGNTVMDFEPEELKRNTSISSVFCVKMVSSLWQPLLSVWVSISPMCVLWLI